MAKPIVDKAEVSIDFPDKFYHGSFGRSCSFDVKIDDDGYHISLDRPGPEHRHVSFHLQHHLFVNILEAITEQISEDGEISIGDLEQLKTTVAELSETVKKRLAASDD